MTTEKQIYQLPSVASITSSDMFGLDNSLTETKKATGQQILNYIKNNTSFSDLNNTPPLTSPYRIFASDVTNTNIIETGISTDIDSGLNIPVSATYKINSSDINTAGTLTNVAYKNQINVFTELQKYDATTHGNISNDYDFVDKKWVEDHSGGTTFWDRIGTTLIPKTSGDNVKVDSDFTIERTGISDNCFYKAINTNVAINQEWNFGLNTGGKAFIIYDKTNNKYPFYMTDNAPDNSFNINPDGFVGLGTSTFGAADKLKIAYNSINLFIMSTSGLMTSQIEDYDTLVSQDQDFVTKKWVEEHHVDNSYWNLIGANITPKITTNNINLPSGEYRLNNININDMGTLTNVAYKGQINTYTGVQKYDASSHAAITADYDIVDRKWVEDHSSGATFWDRVNDSLIPRTVTDNIGLSTQRITKIWLNNFDISGDIYQAPGKSILMGAKYDNGFKNNGSNYSHVFKHNETINSIEGWISETNVDNAALVNYYSCTSKKVGSQAHYRNFNLKAVLNAAIITDELIPWIVSSFDTGIPECIGEIYVYESIMNKYAKYSRINGQWIEERRYPDNINNDFNFTDAAGQDTVDKVNVYFENGTLHLKNKRSNELARISLSAYILFDNT